MKHIMKCSKCGSYTLKSRCCNEKTAEPRPLKFSPDDKYADYRRRFKKEERIKRGLL